MCASVIHTLTEGYEMAKRLRSGSPRMVSTNMLGRAKSNCSKRGSLPKDWDDWFPSLIPLLVPIDGPHITVQHVLDYAIARLRQLSDPTRLLEAAQCLALLHYLGNPPPSTIV